MVDQPPQRSDEDERAGAALAPTHRVAVPATMSSQAANLLAEPSDDRRARKAGEVATAPTTCGELPPVAGTAPETAGLADTRPSRIHSDRERLAFGDLVGDRYEVREHLGSGGMGTVHAGFDRLLEVPVALKFVRPARALDPREQGRLVREVRLAQAITHPNVIRTFTLEEHEGHFFIVMELLDGSSLADELSRTRIPVPEVVRITRDILVGLAAAHAKNTVHRDIKPANIRLCGDGRVVLMDFGIARTSDATAAPEAPPVEITGPRTVLAGTPGYIAPELLRGAAPSIASDLYAVGVVLHQMLVGRLPSEPSTSEAGSSTAARIDPIAPEVDLALGSHGLEDATGVPPQLLDVTRQLLAADPAQRYTSALEVLRALDAAPISDAAPATRPHRRRMWAWLVAAAVAVAIAVVAARGLWPEAPVEPPPTTAPPTAASSPPNAGTVATPSATSTPEVAPAPAGIDKTDDRGEAESASGRAPRGIDRRDGSAASPGESGATVRPVRPPARIRAQRRRDVAPIPSAPSETPTVTAPPQHETIPPPPSSDDAVARRRKLLELGED